MPFEVDTSGWSGEGEFTERLIDRLRAIDGVRFVRVEDAPSTRSDADYNFISNELFVDFATTTREEPTKRFAKGKPRTNRRRGTATLKIRKNSILGRQRYRHILHLRALRAYQRCRRKRIMKKRARLRSGTAL